MKKKEDNKNWVVAKIGVGFLALADVPALIALGIQHLYFSYLWWCVVANLLLFGYLFFEKDNATLKFIFKRKGNILFKN